MQAVKAIVSIVIIVAALYVIWHYYKKYNRSEAPRPVMVAEVVETAPAMPCAF